MAAHAAKQLRARSNTADELIDNLDDSLQALLASCRHQAAFRQYLSTVKTLGLRAYQA
jgi:uncharacterized protein YukE